MKLPVNWVDIAVIVIMAVLIIRNAWTGFFRGLSSFAGLIAGYVIALKYSGLIEGIIAPWLSGQWVKIASYVLAFLVGFLGIFILAELLTYFLKKTRLSWIDRSLGAILGAVKGFLLLAAIFILVTTFFPQGDKYFRHSYTYPYIMKGARFIVGFLPTEIKARFNYNLRRILSNERQI
ncbi:Colicin V production protein [Thermodesulfatator indicus DSM 15286]|uniref:Colicin V production protein n=1 Tax=Thermodesulfatator indicus (strain DSM 15286 / JCM 11887 / CIR29812) TaxID=667014 RepID=F8ACF2_THEID|nr:CvpA family protein [Thermodesulfatator indicus]AEH44653.1 Colicin V production protein [Thermodesulfatator indicus DSM 15286]